MTFATVRAVCYIESKKSIYISIPISHPISPYVKNISVSGSLAILVCHGVVVANTSQSFPVSAMSATVQSWNECCVNILLTKSSAYTTSGLQNYDEGIVRLSNLKLTFTR